MASSESKGLHAAIQRGRLKFLRPLFLYKCPGQNWHWAWDKWCTCCLAEDDDGVYSRIRGKRWLQIWTGRYYKVD